MNGSLEAKSTYIKLNIQTRAQADVLDGQLRGKTADLTFVSKKAYQKSPPGSILSIAPDFL
jgi:hypothetical protein